APVFEVYPQILLGLNGLPTLQQRVGNRVWSGAGVVEQAAEASPVIEGRGVWGLIEASHAKLNPAISTTQADYSYGLMKLQAGIDIPVLDTEAGVLVGGVSVHYGQISADIASVYG